MKHIAPKVNLPAVLKAVCEIGPRFSHAEVNQRHNNLNIETYVGDLDIDDLLSFSFRLFGNHNSISVTRSFEDQYALRLNCGVYDLKKEFLVEGESVEFEIPDRNK